MTEERTRSSPQNSRHHPLIASDRIKGTTVRTVDGRKVGTIKRIMINKVSGEVAYAILAHGGFLGIGERYLPLTWNRLSYDLAFRAYKIDITADELESATPPYASEGDFDWGERNDRLPYYYYMTN
jgi:hypothetical protein